MSSRKRSSLDASLRATALDCRFAETFWQRRRVAVTDVSIQSLGAARYLKMPDAAAYLSAATEANDPAAILRVV